MGRERWGVVSGILVLAFGVIAVLAQFRQDGAPLAETAATSTTSTMASVTDGPSAPTSSPELPGVSSAVDRVLEWNGDVDFADERQLAQLPPTVARVLIAYGVPLRIPVTGNGQ